VTPLRVIVADDELLARKRLARLVEAMAGVELVATCESAEALARALEETTADLILLDIHMPGLSGLDAAALLPSPAPDVIFVTAHPDHALEAFDLGAIDYVLKPVDPARLRRAMARVRRKASTLDRLPIETHEGVVLVDPGTIRHASFDGTLVTIHRDGDPLVTDRSLSELEAQLPAGFERVHRRHLLALAHVARLAPTASGSFVAITVDGDEIPVSRAAARRLRRRLDL